ncbi:MAG: hypothetical protein ACI845_000144 [Gammaproteobacteria bacterium]|jgi:hypothetical protein
MFTLAAIASSIWVATILEDNGMEIAYVLIGSSLLIFIFLMLWLKERKQARMEFIAYGLRGDEGNDENTKTNITVMESGFVEAMDKLEAMGEVSRDQRDQWVWTKTGKPVGQK